MTTNPSALGGKSFDALLFDLDSLKDIPELSIAIRSFLEGEYKAILQNSTSQTLFEKLSGTVTTLQAGHDTVFQDGSFQSENDAVFVLLTGLAAFNAFLQANVTGPPLDLQNVLPGKEPTVFRDRCLRSLDVDGVSVYQHIPHVELFCLARMVFTTFFPRIIQGSFIDCKWMRVRINAYHQRLLSGVSVGRLVDTITLQNVIEKGLTELEDEIFAPTSSLSTESKAQFLLEKAQIHIMQGLDIKAKDDVQRATATSGLSYALSGALGKRTKFQQNDISQLVVFAKSRDPNYSSTENSTNSPE
ncbi:hypothetical protein G7Y89_g3987 [Cudoniella acicularis]|uniref:Uncharacterized protein n=1 Tax=Cudoniella acicularis TaxID=354080 RepID=A0A8H4W5F2_9HELO|nr:hypothetical protein G7Y89_g3987 [Cudoniella acicularis]